MSGSIGDAEGEWPERRFVLLVALGALAGVVLRVVYVATTDIPEFGDARTYHLLGQVLASGEGYIRPWEFFGTGARVPTAEFPPLHPMLLAAADLVGLDSPTAQRVLGALLGGATVVVVGLLGRRLGGPLVGVVAAWIAALSPHLVALDSSLLSEGLYVLLVAFTLLAVFTARGATGRAADAWWAAAGAATGLAILTRSEAALLLPLLLVPAARVPGDPRRWARLAGLAVLCALIPWGAWTVRNAASLGHLQPFTNNSGTLIAGANCDAVYSGGQIGLWRLDCVEVVDVTGLDETEAAAERRRTGVDHALAHPTRLPAVATVRLARTFGVWDVRSQLFFESLEGRDYHWLWGGWATWILLAPLAVAGAVLRRRRGELLWPLLVPVGIVVLTVVASYGNQRFRAVAEPSVVVLAAIAIAALVSRASPRSSPSPGPPADPVTEPRRRRR